MPELKRPAGELRIGPYRPRMPREPPIEVPGGIYHVGSKGNRGCVIYEDDFERRIFLRLLTVVTKRFGWTCHAYVLMSNHFHLLVQLHVGGLSAGMQLLNGCFAKFSNRKNGYLGQHLFRNRFWSEFVEDDSHLLETARYIVLNPVRANICEQPEDWIWSSFRGCAGLDFRRRSWRRRSTYGCSAPRRQRPAGHTASSCTTGSARLPPGVRHSDGLRARVG